MAEISGPHKAGFYWARIPTRTLEWTHIVHILGLAPYLHFIVWDTNKGSTAAGCAPEELGLEIGKRIKQPDEEATP